MRQAANDVFARRRRKMKKLSQRIAALDTLLRYADLDNPQVNWGFNHVLALREQLEAQLHKMDAKLYAPESLPCSKEERSNGATGSANSTGSVK